MLKRLWNLTAVRAAIMIILSVMFMQTVNILRRPSVASITTLLLSLPEYNNMTETGLHGAYADFSDMNVKGIIIYTSADDSSREFAVVKVSPLLVKQTVDIFQNRVQELITEYEQNPEELNRVKYFRIINNGDFVTFTVYDTNSTAENAIHEYFSINKP